MTGLQRRAFLRQALVLTAAAASTLPAWRRGLAQQEPEFKGPTFAFPHQPDSKPLRERIPLPDHLRRLDLEPRSFAAWVRELPVKQENHGVFDAFGKKVLEPEAAYAIVDLDVRRFQECADTAVRLWAEYLWSRGEIGKLHLRLENRSPNPVERELSQANRRSLDRYLHHQYVFSSSLVLKRDLRPVEPPDVLPGDAVVLRPERAPQGHVFIVGDVAVDAATSRKKVVIIQSNIPAQNLHVVPNPPPYVGWGSAYRDEFTPAAGSVGPHPHACWHDWLTFFAHTKYDMNGQGVLRRFG